MQPRNGTYSEWWFDGKKNESPFYDFTPLLLNSILDNFEPSVATMSPPRGSGCKNDGKDSIMTAEGSHAWRVYMAIYIEADVDSPMVDRLFWKILCAKIPSDQLHYDSLVHLFREDVRAILVRGSREAALQLSHFHPSSHSDEIQ